MDLRDRVRPACCRVPFDAHVLKVLIASPGDTLEERNAVEQALHVWNRDRAEREQVGLLPRRWELHAVPRLGGSGQSIINEQLVDKADRCSLSLTPGSAWRRTTRCQEP